MEDYKKEIRDAVRSAVKEALSETCGVVKCPVTPEIAQSIGVIFSAWLRMWATVTTGGAWKRSVSVCVWPKATAVCRKILGCGFQEQLWFLSLLPVLLMIWQGFKQIINK